MQDFDFVIESDDKWDAPDWVHQLTEGIEDRLFGGFLVYGNTDDLFSMGEKLMDLEEYLRVVIGQKFAGPIYFLDPALGVLLDGKPVSVDTDGVAATLTGFLKGKVASTDDCILVIRGGELWLDQMESVWAVKRLVELGATRSGPIVILVGEQIGSLSEMLTQSAFVKKIDIPFPNRSELQQVFEAYGASNPEMLRGVDLQVAADRLSGVKLFPLVNLLKKSAASKDVLSLPRLEEIKRDLVEETCEGLLEFIIPRLNLSDLYGLEKLKVVIRRDLGLWDGGERELMPKGYLLTGPVGIGKTYFVEALAGEAGVPVIKLNNFRSGAVGRTESNLEKIFRMLRSLSRCFVFIDEADQAMGSRTSGADGVSGRVYSMFAQEIASEVNRGKIIWIMATSQPHKLEPDLKRPGRMDLKIPLLPCENSEAAYKLLVSLGKKKLLELATPEVETSKFQEREKIAAEDKYILAAMPPYMTPASAMVIIDDVARKKLSYSTPPSDRELLRLALRDHQPLIPKIVMQEQCRLAVREASDLDFVAAEFQYLQQVEKPFIVL